MKQAKKLTREQKEIVSRHYMNPNDYMYVSESEFYMTIIHKDSGITKRIDKNYQMFRKGNFTNDRI